MIGYYTKDNKEEHLEFVHTFRGMIGYHNVSMEDMNEGEINAVCEVWEGRFEQSCRSLSNILRRAHRWARFYMKTHLGVSLPGTLFHMCKSGQFHPNPTWVVPLRSVGMDVERATSIRKIMMNPVILSWGTSPMSSLTPSWGSQT